MSKSEHFNFTWGVDYLDKMGYVQLYNHMLRNYSALGLERSEMLCLIHLASYRYNSPRGESRPGIARIAKEMNYSERTVMRLIQALEGKGMLRVTRRAGLTSLYDATPFAETSFQMWTQQDTQNVSPMSGVTPMSPPGGDTHVRGVVTPMSPEEYEVEDESQEEDSPSDLIDFPEPKPRERRTPEQTKERIAAALASNAARAEGKAWSVPAHAGGSDDIGDALLPIFCEGVGVAAHALPEKKAASWRKSLREVVGRWGATVEEATTALKALLAEDGELSWKTYSAPFQTGFQSDFDLYLGRVRSGTPLGGKHGQKSHRQDPAFNDGANPLGELSAEEWDKLPIGV